MNAVEPHSGSFLIFISSSASLQRCDLRQSIEPSADWTNYKRSFVQPSWLRTLMKDARGGLIR